MYLHIYNGINLTIIVWTICKYQDSFQKINNLFKLYKRLVKQKFKIIYKNLKSYTKLIKTFKRKSVKSKNNSNRTDEK